VARSHPQSFPSAQLSSDNSRVKVVECKYARIAIFVIHRVVIVVACRIIGDGIVRW